VILILSADGTEVNVNLYKHTYKLLTLKERS
jgi:hypothetical protein